MKRGIFFKNNSILAKVMVIVLITITFTAVSIQSVSAAEYLVGVRGGYFIWDPWLKDLAPLFEEMETGSGALYGPVASVLLTEDLSMSFSGLFGSQTGEGITEDIPDSADYQTLKYSFNIFRMDLDAALSYRVMENFKIFAGYKYWYNKIEYSAIDYRADAPGAGGTLTAVYQEEIEITQPFHGPAAGIGMSMPIGNSGYFFAANLSCLYMWGKMEMESEPMIKYTNGDGWIYGSDLGPDESISMVMYGINIEPTVGLNPGEGLPIFTIGIRYQYNRLKLDSAPEGSGMSEDWLTDQIYGVFVGVLYHI